MDTEIEQRLKAEGYSQRLMHVDLAPGAGEIFRLVIAPHMCTWVDRPFTLRADLDTAGISADAGDRVCKVYSHRASAGETRCLEGQEQKRGL